MSLVLSLFPGIDILGRGFEAEGFCVVRGPDLIYGGDIRDFFVPEGKFDGIIAGSPCQDFSAGRRTPPTGYGVEMLDQFRRVVLDAKPEWFLLENSDRVPDILIDGYKIQRISLNARECGAKQNRPRHIQFGSKSGLVLIINRKKPPNGKEPAVMAMEGRKPDRRSWADFCELQGLPRNFNLPGMTTGARYRAVGNAVHLDVAKTLAIAIKQAKPIYNDVRICPCGCGRILKGKQKSATPACRKRKQRRKERDAAIAE